MKEIMKYKTFSQYPLMIDFLKNKKIAINNFN